MCRKSNKSTRHKSQEHKIVAWLLVCTLASSFITPCLAKESEMKQKAPIIVNGDKVEYFHEQKKVVGTNNISIDYEDVRLTCDKVTVYLDTREAVAEGNVKITQKDAYFTGEKINYNFDARTGKAINAYVNYVPFYGRSQDVEKQGEDQAEIRKGYITTCDLENPHYRVAAKQIKIYFDDKVIARDITFYVGNCPIMYLPYYVQPVKEQSAHVTVQPGHDRDWGYYALASMKYDYNRYFHGRYRLDYRTANGLAVGFDNEYELEGAGKGVVKFYYTHENDSLSYEPETRSESKYRLQVRHEWQVNDDTLATVELNKVRDDNFMKYYFLKEQEEQRQPDNYVTFVTTKENYTTTFLMRKRMDKYFDVVERLPEYNINISKWKIPNTPFYYDADFTPVYLNHTFPNTSVSGQKDIDVIRLDTYNKVSYPIRVLNSLNFTPFAATRQTYYSRNKYGHTNFIRGVFDAGVDVSTKFYKVYDINTNVLDLDINKVRHIITPTVQYLYTPQPTVDADSLHQFDAVDAIKTNDEFILALENKIQTKRHVGDKLVSVDLVDFIISTDFVYRLKNNNRAFKDQIFRTVDMQLELTPYPWLYTLCKMGMDTKRALPQTASIDFVGGKEEDRSLAFGYRYENDRNPDSNTEKLNYLTADAIYKINELWKIRGYWRMNMDKWSFDEHEYTIYRDLHCWTVEFTYDIRPSEDNGSIVSQTFWIAFRLKAFPQTPLGLRRSYSRTRAGEPGDLAYRESSSVGLSR